MRISISGSFTVLVMVTIGCGGGEDFDSWGVGGKGEDRVVTLPPDDLPEVITLDAGASLTQQIVQGKRYMLLLEGTVAENPELRWLSIVPQTAGAVVVTDDGDRYSREEIKVPASPSANPVGWKEIRKRQSDGCYLNADGSTNDAKECYPGILWMACKFRVPIKAMSDFPKPKLLGFWPMCDAKELFCPTDSTCSGRVDRWGYDLKCEPPSTDASCEYGKGFRFRQCRVAGDDCLEPSGWQFCGFPGNSRTPTWHECATPTPQEQAYIAMMLDATVDQLFSCAPPPSLQDPPSLPEPPKPATVMAMFKLEGVDSAEVVFSADLVSCTPDKLETNERCAAYVRGRKKDYPKEYEMLKEGTRCSFPPIPDKDQAPWSSGDESE